MFGSLGKYMYFCSIETYKKIIVWNRNFVRVAACRSQKKSSVPMPTEVRTKTACVKSTCFNMAKAGFTVHVLSDCITSYDLKKLPEMLSYYENKGCEVKKLIEYR